jgi:hypothetical protein
VQKDQSDWAFADAWVLTAVAISQRPCSLTELVATADGINHAIPLDPEVDGAVGKLLGSGLLDVTPDLAFDLTPKGSALVARRHGSLFTQVDSVLSLLASVTARDQEFSLPPGAMQEAVDVYLARSRKH